MKAIIYSMLLILLAGCSVQNNMRNVNQEILFAEEQLQALGRKADTLSFERMNKIAAGKLDQTTDSVTRVYIQRLKDSVNTRLNYFKAIANNHNSRKGKKEMLAYLNAIKQNYSKELNNVVFLDDLFKASTFNRLNTAAFFAPGVYQLTD